MAKIMNDNSIDWLGAEDAPPIVKYPDGDNEDDGAILCLFAILAIGGFICLTLFVILKVMGVL